METTKEYNGYFCSVGEALTVVILGTLCGLKNVSQISQWSEEELLRHARLEWSVESMHWLLDVHFGEDFCRIEDETVQQVLNTVRKITLNCVKTHKQKSARNSRCRK